MKIYIATDHAGFELKNHLKEYLESKGHQVEDFGALAFDGEDDYPEFIYPCAKKVGEDPESRGIVIGGSGQGEAIVANKAKGVRAVVYYGHSLDIVRLSRQHNNSNVLSLGARFLSFDEAKGVVELWLNTEFEGGRHQRRLDKIIEIEQHI